jgi:hypothetical protein
VTEHLRLAQFDDIPVDREQMRRPSIIDEAILKALSEAPFSSVRELAKATCFAVSTVYVHLTQHMGFVLKHLRWVRHLLTEDDRKRRTALSKDLLALLEKSQRKPCYVVVTLDESWFYLYYEREAIWLQPSQAPPERVKHTIQDEKVMITIATTFRGFHLIDALPKGRPLMQSIIRQIFLQSF